MKNTLKVCFVGVGSIGKRHIRNLRTICELRFERIIVDALRRQDSPVINDAKLDHEYYHIEELPYDYDIIFITNPTELHMDSLEMVHNHGKHFFIEKPITSYSTIDFAEKFSYRQNSVYYVACPMRYEKTLQYLKKTLNLSEIISIRCICSSYLPEWRPGIDYRKCYSAKKELGGGVSIDLIHEWDYLTWLFGYPLKVCSMVGKKSDLEITSDDYAIYIAEYIDKVVELHLDYFGRVPIRNMMIFTKNDTVLCDFINGTIQNMKEGTVIDLSEPRDSYQINELNHFLDIIDGKADNDNTPWEACKSLRLSQGIV